MVAWFTSAASRDGKRRSIRALAERPRAIELRLESCPRGSAEPPTVAANAQGLGGRALLLGNPSRSNVARVTGTVTRREFLGTVGAGALAGPAMIGAPDGARRPNILFILADDLGYGDLSSYGRPDYRTPRLDDLALQGVKFTSAYAAAPVCTPTRCALVTGRYPQRLAVGARGAADEGFADERRPSSRPPYSGVFAREERI